MKYIIVYFLFIISNVCANCITQEVKKFNHTLSVISLGSLEISLPIYKTQIIESECNNESPNILIKFWMDDAKKDWGVILVQDLNKGKLSPELSDREVVKAVAKDIGMKTMEIESLTKKQPYLCGINANRKQGKVVECVSVIRTKKSIKIIYGALDWNNMAHVDNFFIVFTYMLQHSMFKF